MIGHFCEFCKQYVKDSDWFDPCNMCDNCFDEMMESEERDFEILYQQKNICAICNKPITAELKIKDGGVLNINLDESSAWCVNEGKAVHTECIK